MVAVLRPYRAASIRKSRDAPYVLKTSVLIISPCLVDDVGTSIPSQEEPPGVATCNICAHTACGKCVVNSVEVDQQPDGAWVDRDSGN